MTLPEVEEQAPMTYESDWIILLFCFDLASLRVGVVMFLLMMVSTLYYTLAFQTSVI